MEQIDLFRLSYSFMNEYGLNQIRDFRITMTDLKKELGEYLFKKNLQITKEEFYKHHYEMLTPAICSESNRIDQEFFLKLCQKNNKSIFKQKMDIDKITIYQLFTNMDIVNNTFVKMGAGWAVVSLNGEFIFFFQDVSCTFFAERTIPECFYIDQQGSIFGKEERVYFPFWKKPWPWPIESSHKYRGLGEINWLLVNHDENPVSIMTKSLQPYKGLGMQIAKELEKIYSHLVEHV